MDIETSVNSVNNNSLFIDSNKRFIIIDNYDLSTITTALNSVTADAHVL